MCCIRFVDRHGSKTPVMSPAVTSVGRTKVVPVLTKPSPRKAQ
jgi:hypothetical protein